MENYKLFYSLSHDPHVNLALEFDLLKQANSNEVLLFMYRNSPAIVFGRFQNPWREIKFTKLPEDITLVRRHSGGGTVYHDLGNWNFCFIRDGKKLEEIKNLTLIKNALKHFSLDVQINERSDLVMNLDCVRKVSGSAFRRTKDANFHHGTLLINANLSSLKGVLGKESNMLIEGKGVASYPSPVVNLSEINDDISWDTFLLEIERMTNRFFICLDEDKVDHETKEYLAMMRSWQWKWGQGPEFVLTIDSPLNFLGKITIKWSKGIIKECQSELVGNGVSLNDELESFFTGLSVHKSYLMVPEIPIYRYLYKIFLSHHY